QITSQQALFCPSAIQCFDPQDRVSVMVAVTQLSPVQWNKLAFKQLVLDEKKKATIRSLVQNHSEEFSNSTEDIIKGKGDGLVIVLHGPPGVGKTLTAESVAEFTEKPLITLRVSNLLTDRVDFSTTISKFLAYSVQLGAILLLDEADVILESRSYEDIKRNGMVSTFLQTLEYFKGIMFMTTNRIGTMDHAFQSRIQFAAEYTTLSTTTRRKIWKVFIERLENDDSRDDLLDNMDYLKDLKLNGRQIRNTMKLAQSLAIQE
ncbi:P-loop containing nucleoside triphosphate hydrolase protein, partial [Leptodontidium sp. 2 PMI_412]